MNQTVRLVSVRLTPQERIAVEFETLKSLILIDHENIVNGPLVLIDKLFAWVMIVMVSKVEQTTIGELDIETCKRVGYPSRAAIIDRFRTLTHGVDKNTKISIITWECVLGSVISKETLNEIRAEIKDLEKFVNGFFGRE